MSVETELAKIQADYETLNNTKSALKASIEGKGVSVPSNTKMSGFPSLIDSIVQGGGLPSGISKLDFGTITVSSNISTTAQTFTHNLGVIPDLMIVWADSNVATTYSMLCAIRGSNFGWRSSAYNSHYAYHGNSTTTVTWANSNNANYGIGSMTATNFKLASHSTSYYWRARSYNYIAIKF